MLPSALSLTKVDYAPTRPGCWSTASSPGCWRCPPIKRPKFYLFGESLGFQVSEEMFRGTGTSGPTGIGLEAAVLDRHAGRRPCGAQEIWGTRTVAEAPEIGPGPFYLPRAIRDWDALPVGAESDEVRVPAAAERRRPGAQVRPVAGVEPADWLGPDAQRPPGSPRGTAWLPVVTFVTTFIDLQNALVPTPGVFEEGGHDYHW